MGGGFVSSLYDDYMEVNLIYLNSNVRNMVHLIVKTPEHRSGNNTGYSLECINVKTEYQ